ncbi:cytochrome P450 [Armillaria borealis]|uniref:Cytochrome P450 n=1 Tax=Armillaria borealis TaxID=47425 RepID=A0AA39J6W3_9AGAR|nr:cytochrome P450 [Armillaria borealis]
MLTSLATLDIAIVLAGLAFVWRLFRRNNGNAPFPPGPKGLPVIGNLLDMPTEKEWLTFAKWGDKYGDMASVGILGRRLVVLNSAQMAISILDKKSSIYSDRPVVGMGGELIGWKNSLPLMPYGARFRNHRRLAHQLFGTNVTMNQFLPMLELETRRSLKRILTRPEELSEHIRKTAGAIILQISHGYTIQEEDDPFIELAERTMNQSSLATAPGGFLANIIPILTRVPDWLPGAGFKRTAREWASTLNDFAAGTARHSLTSSQLEGEVTAEEDNVKWLASALYAGGADTTVAAIYAFFKAMLLYPDIQAKAQAEIDAVIGGDRLPRFDDRERLPYVNALALEVSRWHTVGPTGISHCVTEDDVQSGYFIPKGSLVFANIWKMLHDPAVYDQPFEFKPERFIRTGGKEPEFDPHKVAFGFGRRICPGRVLADASIFISCAMALSVFNISKLYSEYGVAFEPDTEHTAGSIRQELSLILSLECRFSQCLWFSFSHPTSFKCVIKPRSEKAFGLIIEERSD